MRTRHLGLDDPTANPASTQAASVSGEGARISGIRRPEFPEPTWSPHYEVRNCEGLLAASTNRLKEIGIWVCMTYANT
jgi:hypothetical protein